MSKDLRLDQAISGALTQLEAEGEIIVCSPSQQRIVDRLIETALTLVPHTTLTATELNGLRLLVLQATANTAFFDWEMPTLTGFSAAEFRAIADKLPSE